MFGLKKIKKYYQQLAEKIDSQSEFQQQLAKKIGSQSEFQQQLAEKIGSQSEFQQQLAKKIGSQSEALSILEHNISTKIDSFGNISLITLGHQYKRNFLPNNDAALQKILIMHWRSASENIIDYKELLDSGFRVFSQNDEDGIILRIFAHIGTTNKYVIEIGSNTSGSCIDIPENISTNLIINHGWHGSIFEMDEVECSKITNFYANNLATKHFHIEKNGVNGYFSPQIIKGMVDAKTINTKISNANVPEEPDLMIIDIDGGDLAVIKALTSIQPRVLVVEFEKRFRERFSVAQSNSEDFCLHWAQSGATSLPAWETLLAKNNYILCGINSTGFNAFFIKREVAVNKVRDTNSAAVFDSHPIFSNMTEDFWVQPDETWEKIQ